MTSGTEPAGRLYLDTNVLIAAIEQTTEEAFALRRLLARGHPPSAGLQRFLTSELTLAECLVRPMRDGNHELARRYLEVVATTDGLATVPISRVELARAAWLRANYASLRLPDALHLACAFAGNCTHFVSADRRLAPTHEIATLDARWRDLGLDPASVKVLDADPARLEALLP